MNKGIQDALTSIAGAKGYVSGTASSLDSLADSLRLIGMETLADKILDKVINLGWAESSLDRAIDSLKKTSAKKLPVKSLPEKPVEKKAQKYSCPRAPIAPALVAIICFIMGIPLSAIPRMGAARTVRR